MYDALQVLALVIDTHIKQAAHGRQSLDSADFFNSFTIIVGMSTAYSIKFQIFILSVHNLVGFQCSFIESLCIIATRYAKVYLCSRKATYAVLCTVLYVRFSMFYCCLKIVTQLNSPISLLKKKHVYLSECNKGCYTLSSQSLSNLKFQ